MSSTAVRGDARPHGSLPIASPSLGGRAPIRRPCLNDPVRPEVVARLLAASASGSDASFAELYALTHTRVNTVVLRVVRSPDHAREVTQEVFLEVWCKAATCDAARGSALSWMMTIAHRRAIDRVRTVSAAASRDQANSTREGSGHDGDSWDEVVSRLDARRVHGALSVLSARQREAVVLMYFEQHSSNQIAVRLGLPLGTVKTRVRDGLRSMRSTLSPA